MTRHMFKPVRVVFGRQRMMNGVAGLVQRVVFPSPARPETSMLGMVLLVHQCMQRLRSFLWLNHRHLPAIELGQVNTAMLRSWS